MEHAAEAARRALSSASAPQPVSELPKAVIDRVWLRMTEIYGHKWTSSYGTSDTDGTWAKALADMSNDDLKAGFFACLHSGEAWPPSLPEFRVMCRPKKVQRENEAVYRYTGPTLPHLLSDERRAAGRAQVASALAKLKNLP